jgi:hypothetical protein
MAQAVYLICYQDSDARECDSILGVYRSLRIAEKHMRQFFIEELQGYCQCVSEDEVHLSPDEQTKLVKQRVKEELEKQDKHCKCLISSVYTIGSSCYYIECSTLNEEKDPDDTSDEEEGDDEGDEDKNVEVFGNGIQVQWQ